METLIIILAGVLVTVATYLLLSKNLIRVILGTTILTHAGHLFLMSMGGFKGSSVPILGEKTAQFVDALPQALILSSIVISFVVLAYRAYDELGTDNVMELRGMIDE